jgi:cytochrome P450
MAYLEQLDAAPAAQHFALVRGWMDREPLPFFAELRARRPILKTPVCTLVALYDDVLEVLRQPALFSVALYGPKMGDYMLAVDDTPMHFRDKAIMQAMLNRDDLPRVRALVARRAAEALAGATTQIDLVPALSRAVPIAVVKEYFGFEGAPPEKMAQWSYWNQYDAFHNHAFNIVPDAAAISARRVAALDEMKAFLGALVQKRVVQIWAGARPDDVASRLIRTQLPGEVGFPVQRMVINIGGLLIGAIETTSQAVIHATAELFSRPAVLAEARAAAQQGAEKFDGFFWEALRFRPIAPYMFRVAEADAVLGRNTAHQTTIAKGSIVLPLVLSSNFDPARFANADAFDPTRAQHHTFHLGHGLHECLGRYVAEVMLPEMVRQIVLAEHVAPAGAIDYRGGPFPESWVFTAPA